MFWFFLRHLQADCVSMKEHICHDAIYILNEILCAALYVWVNTARYCALFLCAPYECCKPTEDVGLQHSYSAHNSSAKQRAAFTHTHNTLHAPDKQLLRI